MIAVLTTLAWILGPLGIAIVVALPSLILTAVLISHRDSVRVQLSADATRSQARKAARR